MSDSLLAVIIIITFINSHVVFRKSEKRSSIDSVNQHMNSLCSKIKKLFFFTIPAGNCMFKVNNRNTRTRCEICSKLTIKTPERR